MTADDPEDAPFAVKPEEEELKEQDQPKLWRVRYLPQSCYRTVLQALKFDPHYSLAICFREGVAAPNCINARRAARAKARSETLKKKAEESATKPQKKLSPLVSF